MIPRILLFLALVATVVGISVSTFRLIARSIEKRRSIFQAMVKDKHKSEMGEAELAFRMGKFAQQYRRLTVAKLTGGALLTVLGGYGTVELVRRLASEAFSAFLQHGLSIFYFASPLFIAYGLYVVIASIGAMKKN